MQLLNLDRTWTWYHPLNFTYSHDEVCQACLTACTQHLILSLRNNFVLQRFSFAIKPTVSLFIFRIAGNGSLLLIRETEIHYWRTGKNMNWFKCHFMKNMKMINKLLSIDKLIINTVDSILGGGNYFIAFSVFSLNKDMKDDGNSCLNSVVFQDSNTILKLFKTTRYLWKLPEYFIKWFRSLLFYRQFYFTPIEFTNGRKSWSV